jgi:hypothetical protein
LPNKGVRVHIPEFSADVVIFLTDGLEDRMVDELIREVGDDFEVLIGRELVMVRDADPLQVVITPVVTRLIVQVTGEERRGARRALSTRLLPVGKQLLSRE